MAARWGDSGGENEGPARVFQASDRGRSLSVASVPRTPWPRSSTEHRLSPGNREGLARGVRGREGVSNRMQRRERPGEARHAETARTMAFGCRRRLRAMADQAQTVGACVGHAPDEFALPSDTVGPTRSRPSAPKGGGPHAPRTIARWPRAGRRTPRPLSIPSVKLPCHDRPCPPTSAV